MAGGDHTIPYHTILYYTARLPYYTIPYYTVPYTLPKDTNSMNSLQAGGQQKRTGLVLSPFQSPNSLGLLRLGILAGLFLFLQ